MYILCRPTDSRRELWIENSGNEALRDISAKTKKVFCEIHFDAKSMRKQFMRTTLRKDAVPLKYVPSQEAESLHDTTSKFRTAIGQQSGAALIIISFSPLCQL